MDCRPVALFGGACTLGATIAYQLAAKGYTPVIIDHNQTTALDIVAHDPRVRFKEAPALTQDTLQVTLDQCTAQLSPFIGAVIVSELGHAYIQSLGIDGLDAFCQVEARCVVIATNRHLGSVSLNDKPATNRLQRINSISFWSDHNINTDVEILPSRKKSEVLSPLVCFLLSDESNSINDQEFKIKL
ncbi:hypothetical protein BZG06_10540 [Salinivibrio kushneri]|uniref:THIF-type NAD/FAD binding fold domain-containing protein n=1 Tax=Salinivibrio kushneri TaxID=1908198 RepID=A0AB36K3D1_9GAMM|nr:hypothetical protein [Salinivibrio kushneri]OOE41551.1 hypothetical protein BZG00_00835 [Salinivibrio kushneri]OOE42705.1 hypothetical protein BZG09_12780 [Salinivibrio kushneri]OOE43769.1 hypothetical protein BZG06_10540 [Salinivibrio kushneri]QCP02101.1 hypothetical protein FCN78_06665 [Salinivibrio kushneri]